MKKWSQYIITTCVALLLVLCVLMIQDTFEHAGTLLLAELCNAFFVPGVLVLCFGLLLWASNGGAFDMLAYGVMKLFDLFKKDLTRVKYRTFYDYREAQKDNKRTCAHYIVVGMVLIAISIIFYILYKNY